MDIVTDRRMFGLKFRRRVPLENYIADFYCHDLRLIIELDGSGHDDPPQLSKDKRRDADLRKNGYKILRVPNGLVMKAPQEFAEEVRRFLRDRGTDSELWRD